MKKWLNVSKKLNKGLRQYQTERAIESQISILKILSYDEDLHQYSELKEKTRLSDATLSKQLKQLKEMKIIERKLDTESGRYPPPVYYGLNPSYAEAFRGAITFEIYKKADLEREIRTGLSYRNPLEMMREIDKQTNIALFGILIFLQGNRNADERIVRFLLELLVWKPYKVYTEILVERILPIIDKFDLKNLVMEV